MPKSYDLSLTVSVEDVSAEPRVFEIEATQDQRDDVIKRFKIIALDSFGARVEVGLSREYKGFLVHGHINASLKQQCIVTLKPVSEAVDEDFELLLVAPDVANQFDEDEMYLDPDAPDYDALEGNSIDVGEIIVQTLSVMMNPYPRREDADLSDVASNGISINEAPQKKPNPFAVLSKLNDES